MVVVAVDGVNDVAVNIDVAVVAYLVAVHVRRRRRYGRPRRRRSRRRRAPRCGVRVFWVAVPRASPTVRSTAPRVTDPRRQSAFLMAPLRQKRQRP